jgi:uncharacterized tellurite resistance protein B-like protein
MLDRLRTLLEDLAAGNGEDGGAESGVAAMQLAAATLLIELTRADTRVDESELQSIREAIQHAYGLSEAEAGELMEQADREADDAVSLHNFTHTLNTCLSPQQKGQFVEHMWRVAYADGRIDKYEDHYIRKVAELLYIPHSKFIRAKLKAAKRNQSTA